MLRLFKRPLLTAVRFLVLASIAAVCGPRAEEDSDAGQVAPKTGIIEGVIRYEADLKRPWKFGRYYVHNSTGGSLGEAVVALEISGGAGVSEIPKGHVMDQVNFQFVPETMAIRAGEAVRITNSDEALHNVMTADGGKPFNVNVAKGKESIHRFEQAGGMERPIRLGCVFHGGMRAWIYVFDHPWFKVTEGNGRFRFAGVPAGEYTLAVAHPAGRLHWKGSIKVKPNETTAVEIPLSPDHLTGSKRAKDE